MPESNENHSLPPGASGEEILRQMLPVLVEALTKSAEGHTSSAAAIQALEAQVAELKANVQGCQGEIKRIADEETIENKRKEENGKWMRSLIKPETVYYTLVIVLTALGFRLSTVPTQTLPVPSPPTVQQGEAP